MADFCRQCGGDMFGPEFNTKPDLEGITTMGDQMAGLFVVVLCEGCGPILVDMWGNCVSEDCLESGHK